MPQGTNALVIFPGKAEIGGQICTITDKLTVSGMAFHDSSTDLCGSCYVVMGQPASGEELTASDVFLVDGSSITITASYGVETKGYYYGAKRLIACLNNEYSSCQNLAENYQVDPPTRPFKKELTAAEASALGFAYIEGDGGTTTTGARVYYGGLRLFDPSVNAYTYHMKVIMASGGDAGQPFFDTYRHYPSYYVAPWKHDDENQLRISGSGFFFFACATGIQIAATETAGVGVDGPVTEVIIRPWGQQGWNV